MRVYEESPMTKVMTQALTTAIAYMESYKNNPRRKDFGPEHEKQLSDMKDLVNKIRSGAMDVRLSARNDL